MWAGRFELTKSFWATGATLEWSSTSSSERFLTKTTAKIDSHELPICTGCTKQVEELHVGR